MMDADVEFLLRARGGTNNTILFHEIDRLRDLVAKGMAVVEDFMPNIGGCVLQNYQRLNEFMIEARAVGWQVEKVKSP